MDAMDPVSFSRVILTMERSWNHCHPNHGNVLKSSYPWKGLKIFAIFIMERGWNHCHPNHLHWHGVLDLYLWHFFPQFVPLSELVKEEEFFSMVAREYFHLVLHSILDMSENFHSVFHSVLHICVRMRAFSNWYLSAYSIKVSCKKYLNEGNKMLSMK